jgi:ribosomal-protein-alanine N-acetyltransferase
VTPQVTVRLAEPRDLAAVLELERGVREAPHWAEEIYREALQNDEGDVRRCLLLAEVDRRLVGFAMAKVARLGDEVAGELESVAVASETRRQGVGLALCAAVMVWCGEAGAGHVELEVRVGSSGAITLYEGLGFIATGRRRGYYREPVEDAFLMVKELRA